MINVTKRALSVVAMAAATAQPIAAMAQADFMCPPTIKEAQALLARQGALPPAGSMELYRTDGLVVLGAKPARVSSGKPTVIWSFAILVPATMDQDYQNLFRKLYADGGTLEYRCPTTPSQCEWASPGWGQSGLQPDKAVLGELLYAQLSQSYYSTPSGYTLSCGYYFKPHS